jgi:hypothetical protein
MAPTPSRKTLDGSGTVVGPRTKAATVLPDPSKVLSRKGSNTGFAVLIKENISDVPGAMSVEGSVEINEMVGSPNV